MANNLKHRSKYPKIPRSRIPSRQIQSLLVSAKEVLPKAQATKPLMDVQVAHVAQETSRKSKWYKGMNYTDFSTRN